MKKLLVFIIICFSFLAWSEKATAQIHPDLTFGGTYFPAVDTAGQTVNIQINLFNIGTDSFTYADHKFTFYVYEDSFTSAAPSFNLIPTFVHTVNGTNGHMDVNDSLAFSIPINLASPPFRVGSNNEIVIWPKTAPGEIDSTNNFTKVIFYLYDPSAGSAFLPSEKGRLAIYPSLTNQNMVVDLHQVWLKEAALIRICNANGTLLFTEKIYPGVTNLYRTTTDWHMTDAGIYFISLQTNKETMIQKVVVTK
jgi:hypothetical protein